MSSFCPGCGIGVVEGERSCSKCGRDLQSHAPAPLVDPGIAFGLAPETSVKAIFSMVVGLFVIIPFSLVAVIFGHLSLSDIHRSQGRLVGKGFAYLGLVLGYLGTVATIALIIFAGVEANHASRERAAGKSTIQKDARNVPITAIDSTNQPAAVTVLRTLNTAEIAYAQAHRDTGYTCSMTELSTVWGINSDMAQGAKAGYSFNLEGCSAAKPNGPVTQYQIVAYPVDETEPKLPAYCSNQTDDIKVDRNGSKEDCLTKGVDYAPEPKRAKSK